MIEPFVGTFVVQLAVCKSLIDYEDERDFLRRDCDSKVN